MTIRSRRHLSGTFAWALSLAALTVTAGLLASVLRDTPNRVLVALALTAFVAGASGIVLNWRLGRAHVHALRDPLTGLPNRLLLEDRIEQALRRSQRTGESFTLIVVDLDGFKDVNDVRGHAAGDAVLRTLSRRFESILRAGDTVARVGGDEFVVLTLGARNDDQAEALAGRLRHALRRPFRIAGSSIEIDASIGFAIYPADGVSSDELLTRADGRMYATKRDSVDDEILLRRGVDASIVHAVEGALERNELAVVYQPIIHLQSGAPHAAEALVRRILPDRGLQLPSDFVPHVERTPVVREMTFLVVADALRSAALWREAGYELGVSVNVPYRLLDDPQFGDGIARLMRAADVQAGVLTLDVVPAGPGAGGALDGELLRRLSSLGVRLSLDDGGRAASFSALRVLPLDELKIDAGFVHGLGRSLTDAALVHGMIDIGHALGLEVVAEGVETREAWHVLADWGCDYAQGFYVASPRSAADLVTWLDGAWPAVA